MNEPSIPYLAFRGKARPDDSAAHSWHPTAYHCLDVAACLGALLELREHTAAKASRLLGLSEADSRRLLLVLSVLHDVGKFGECFFSQAEALWPSTLGKYQPDIPSLPHTAAGFALWKEDLRDQFAGRIISGDLFDAEPLFAAAFGHHGRPLTRGGNGDIRSYFVSTATRQAAHACASDAIAMLCERPIQTPTNWEENAAAASWWVAGIVSIADWLGSNQRWFPYHAPSMNLAEYWGYALPRARMAVREAGLVSSRPSALKSFSSLTGISQEPSPTQSLAMNIPLPASQGLFILEDVTGAGKTEAAHVLVHRLMAAGRATGAYWAMPTQATANAMYERQRKCITALFDESDGRLPSLVLTHGQARLYDGFRSTVMDHCESPSLVHTDTDTVDGSDSTVACAAFIADDRRASLLADIGAGTIDQALLSVLPSKFNTIRLFGLAEKVLVLDEVHAYDAYMREEITTLLRFHSALGGSAVILSATLPHDLRQSLVTAWQRGCGKRDARRVESDAVARASVPYPLATVVDGTASAMETPIAAAARSHRSVGVRFLHEDIHVVDRICEANTRGEAVAWIRNTVDSCLQGAEMLRQRGVHAMVFHSRFAQCDRQARELEVMQTFGRDSVYPERARVLVATQVVEQSLDLDFDLLVSDLAPIDLLIQRAGRLWRHERERPAGSERLMYVLTPRYADEPGPNWLDAVLPKTKSVYENVGVLWRTLRALDRSPSIDTPGGIRAMVEEVYASDEVPASLERGALSALGAEKAHASLAQGFVLRFDDGYCADSYLGWYSDVRVPTRLIDKQTVVRLARVRADGSLAPWAPGDSSDWRAWALSEVRVSAWKVPPGASVSAEHSRAVNAIRKEWPKYERDVLVVPLIPRGDHWLATLGTPKGASLQLSYDGRVGIGWSAEDGAVPIQTRMTMTDATCHE